jgi:hypothetical protein
VRHYVSKLIIIHTKRFAKFAVQLMSPSTELRLVLSKSWHSRKVAAHQLTQVLRLDASTLSNVFSHQFEVLRKVVHRRVKRLVP